MKKVRMEQAGRLVDVVVYPVSKGRGTRAERSSAVKASGTVRQAMNDRSAVRKFRRLLACNFEDQDLVTTLTYADDRLPRRPEDARDLYLKPFIVKLRRQIRADGEDLRYMYVTEGMHGDKRLHHHIVLPAVAGVRDMVRGLWIGGENVNFETIGSRGVDVWAGYLTKEPRKTGRRYVGERMWTPSLNLKKPTVTEYTVDDDFYEFSPPPGAEVELNETVRNDWFVAQYVSYTLPREAAGVDSYGKM